MQIELPLTTIFQVFVNNTNQKFLYQIDNEEFEKFQQIKVPPVGIKLTTVLQDLRISFFKVFAVNTKLAEMAVLASKDLTTKLLPLGLDWIQEIITGLGVKCLTN